MTAAAERPTITTFMEAAAHRIAPFIPPDMSAERVAQQVYFATKQTPQLLKCTGDSLLRGIVEILEWGLVLNRTAWLVPFRDKATGKQIATPIAHYRGLAQLMIDSRAVKFIRMRAVYAKDGFEYVLGLNPVLMHRPVGDVKERGEIIGAYCIYTLPNGYEPFAFMSISEIEEIRRSFSQKWHPDKVPVCPKWYAEKTVLRSSSKLVPMNSKFAKVLEIIERDRAAEGDEEAFAASSKITAPGLTLLPSEKPENLVGQPRAAEPDFSMLPFPDDV